MVPVIPAASGNPDLEPGVDARFCGHDEAHKRKSLTRI